MSDTLGRTLKWKSYSICGIKNLPIQTVVIHVEYVCEVQTLYIHVHLCINS